MNTSTRFSMASSLTVLLLAVLCSTSQAQRATRTQQAGLPARSYPKLSPVPAELQRLADSVTLDTVNLEVVDAFFRNDAWVERFTNCIVDSRTCQTKFGKNFVVRLANAQKGGELCKGCDRARKIQQLNVIIRALSIFRTEHPEQFEKVEKKLAFLDL